MADPLIPKGEYEDAKKAFLEWRALPEGERQPSTQKELAKILGVGEPTLSIWAGSEWFQRAYRRKVMMRLANHRAEVYEALISAAKKENVGAIKLYAELLGDNVQQIDITSGGKSITEADARRMSAKDLARKLAAEKAKEADLREKGVTEEQVIAVLEAISSATVKTREDGEPPEVDS